MKGALALLLGGKPSKSSVPPKMGGMSDDEETEEQSPDSESGEGEGSEAQYAKLVIDAMKDGDDAGAAKALVELVRCCK